MAKRRRIISLLLTVFFITPLIEVKVIEIPSAEPVKIDCVENSDLRSYAIKQVEDGASVQKQKLERIEREKAEEQAKLEEIERGEIEEQKKNEEEILVELSFYTSTYEECSRTDGLTASGVYATPYYTIAMDSSIPFGTLINIEGFGVMEVQDTGSAIGIYYNEQGQPVYQVDVYLGYDTQRALELGRYITKAIKIN